MARRDGDSASIVPASLLSAAAFLALALQYVYLTPVFEAPDEPAHFEYVRLLQAERRIPVYDFAIPLRYQAKHPPLYYAALALVFHPRTVGEWLPEASGSAHLRYPHRSDEQRRWRGVFRLRAVQLACGVATVLLTFAIGRRVSPDPRCAAFAAFFVATLPQFQFGSATLSNDNLANTLGALCLLHSVRCVSRSESSRREAALAGLLSGLGLLAKLSTLWCAPLYGFALWLRGGPARPRVVAAAIGAGVTLLVAGPFYAWFWHTTGAPFPHLPNADPMGLTSERLGAFARLTAASFVGVFGWMSHGLPSGVYRTFFAVLLLGAAGWGLRLRRSDGHEGRNAALLCALAVLAALGLYVSYNAFQDFAPMSRYLFTALPALAVLVAVGIGAVVQMLPGERPRALAWSAIAGALLAASLAALIDWAQLVARET